MQRFVDRDMVMRYLGGAVGHRSKPADLSCFRLPEDANMYATDLILDEEQEAELGMLSNDEEFPIHFGARS